jgi:hypothetical protein
MCVWLRREVSRTAEIVQLSVTLSGRIIPEVRGDGDPLGSLRTSDSFRRNRDGRTLARSGSGIFLQLASQPQFGGKWLW